MIKALLIAPYNGLAETGKSIALPEDIHLDTTVANLDEGVTKAKLAEEQGYDIIISRGGTASLIQEAVSIPVIHIEITGYDMLRVFTLISGVKSGVALVGFRNISEGAATICNILDFDVKMVTIESSSEVQANLEQLKKEGVSVVIGDVITVEVAQRLGLRGVLITSGKEAIMNAVDEAKRIHHFFRRVNYRHQIYKQAFDQMPLPMVLIDGEGSVIEQNVPFTEIDAKNELVQSDLLFSFAKRVISHRRSQWEEAEIGSRIYQLQGFLVSERENIVGVQINTSNKKTGDQVIRVIGQPVHQPLIGNSGHIRELEEQIDRVTNDNQLIHLVGEQGTGKYTVAQQIHFKRFGQAAPMIEIEGSLFSKDAGQVSYMEELFDSLTSGTVVVKDLDLVSREEMRELGDRLASLSNQIKIITLQKELLDFDGLGELDGHVVTLLPLRERKEDILAFIDYFLTEIHMENGSETVGIKEEAAEYLLQFDWKGNVPELRSVVKQLSRLASGYYIDRADVEKVMNKTSRNSVNEPLLQGTLKEIERQVIEQVLAEENQNQTKAAQRLGINRSTLWRKLKDE